MLENDTVVQRRRQHGPEFVGERSAEKKYNMSAARDSQEATQCNDDHRVLKTDERTNERIFTLPTAAHIQFTSSVLGRRHDCYIGSYVRISLEITQSKMMEEEGDTQHTPRWTAAKRN